MRFIYGIEKRSEVFKLFSLFENLMTLDDFLGHLHPNSIHKIGYFGIHNRVINDVCSITE